MGEEPTFEKAGEQYASIEDDFSELREAMFKAARRIDGEDAQGAIDAMSEIEDFATCVAGAAVRARRTLRKLEDAALSGGTE